MINYDQLPTKGASSVPLEQLPSAELPLAPALPPPIAIRLKSKFWKTRMEAYRQLINEVQSQGEEWAKALQEGMGTIKGQSHMQCMQVLLKLLNLAITNERKFDFEPNQLSKWLLDKGFGSGKDKIKNSAQQLFSNLIQISDTTALNALFLQLSNKTANPKKLSDLLRLCAWLISQYGEAIALPILDKLQFVDFTNKLNQAAGVQLFRQAYSATKNKSLLQGKCPKELKQSLAKIFSSINPQQRFVPLRFFKKTLSSKCNYSSAPQSDPFKNYGPQWCKKVSQQKWKGKKEALDKLNDDLKCPKLATRNIDCLVQTLKKLIGDVNCVVQMAAVQSVGLLGMGMRKGFKKYSKRFLAPMLQFLKDKKDMVVENSHKSLLKLSQSYQLIDMVQNLKAALSDKNPQFRANTLKFLKAFLQNDSNEEDKKPQTFRQLLQPILKLTDDPTCQVRQKAYQLLGKMVSQFGQIYFGRILTSMPSKKIDRIMVHYRSIKPTDSGFKHQMSQQMQIQPQQPAKVIIPQHKKSLPKKQEPKTAIQNKPLKPYLKKLAVGKPQPYVLQMQQIGNMQKLSDPKTRREGLQGLERQLIEKRLKSGDLALLVSLLKKCLSDPKKAIVRSTIQFASLVIDQFAGQFGDSLNSFVQTLCETLMGNQKYGLVKIDLTQLFNKLIYAEGQKIIEIMLNFINTRPEGSRQLLAIIDKKMSSFTSSLQESVKTFFKNSQFQSMQNSFSSTKLLEVQDVYEGQILPSKEQRLASQPLNPWPLQTFNDWQLDCLKKLLKLLPKQLNQSMLSQNSIRVCESAQKLGNLKDLQNYSDIVCKWISYRLQNGRKTVILQVLRLAEKLIIRIRNRLSDTQIAILGAAFRTALGQDDSQIITAVSKTFNAFKETVHLPKVVKMLVVMLLQGPSDTPKQQIVQILRQSFIQHLQEELLALAKVPQAAYNKKFYNCLCKHYKSDLLQAVGFNFQQMSQRSFVKPQYLSRNSAAQAQQLFQRLNGNQADTVNMLESLSQIDERAEIMVGLLHSSASNFMDKMLMGSELFVYIRVLTDFLPKIFFSNALVLKDLFRLLTCLLIFSDQNKASSRVCQGLVKVVNSLICKSIEAEGSPGPGMLKVLFQILSQRRVQFGYNKTVALTAKCIDKFVKSHKFYGLFNQFYREMELFLEKHYNQSQQGQDTLSKFLSAIFAQASRGQAYSGQNSKNQILTVMIERWQNNSGVQPQNRLEANRLQLLRTGQKRELSKMSW